jgi:hypothetical protein
VIERNGKINTAAAQLTQNLTLCYTIFFKQLTEVSVIGHLNKPACMKQFTADIRMDKQTNFQVDRR